MGTRLRSVLGRWWMHWCTTFELQLRLMVGCAVIFVLRCGAHAGGGGSLGPFWFYLLGGEFPFARSSGASYIWGVIPIELELELARRKKDQRTTQIYIAKMTCYCANYYVCFSSYLAFFGNRKTNVSLGLNQLPQHSNEIRGSLRPLCGESPSSFSYEHSQ